MLFFFWWALAPPCGAVAVVVAAAARSLQPPPPPLAAVVCADCVEPFAFFAVCLSPKEAEARSLSEAPPPPFKDWKNILAAGAAAGTAEFAAAAFSEIKTRKRERC